MSGENNERCAAEGPLTFESMDGMVDAYRADNRAPGPSAWERYWLWIGLLGAALGLTLGNIFQGAWGIGFAVLGLAVELVGLGLSILLTLIRQWPSLRHPKRELARDLDHDFNLWSRFASDLRRYPATQRQKMLRYVRDRRQTMGYRTGLVLGGVERLGILPLLLALYLQFKDWEWGDWGMLAEINLVQGLLILALVLVYLCGWRLVRLHARVEGYEQLLIEATAQDQEAESSQRGRT